MFYLLANLKSFILNKLYRAFSLFLHLGENHFTKTYFVGAFGEWIARRHLLKLNCVVLEQNWKCKLGEVDIIALQKNILVFVEVKTRIPGKHDYSPLGSVTMAKREKLQKLARAYMRGKRKQLKKYCIKGMRFDLIGVRLYRERVEVEHIERAITAKR